jgi:hypothetical protein
MQKIHYRADNSAQYWALPALDCKTGCRFFLATQLNSLLEECVFHNDRGGTLVSFIMAKEGRSVGLHTFRKVLIARYGRG